MLRRFTAADVDRLVELDSDRRDDGDEHRLAPRQVEEELRIEDWVARHGGSAGA